MECKYCGAELDESLQVCPCCGGNLEEDLLSERSETDFSTDVDLTNTEETVEMPIPVQQRKLWQIILAVGCCVVLIASLALIVLKLTDRPEPDNNEDANEETSTVADEKEDTTVYDGEAEKVGHTVIAKIGDIELTNGELQVFYTQQVYEYIQYYGSVLSYIGLDTSRPFSEQTCMLDQSLTWQQYFVNIAVETWQRYAILNLLADEENIELPDYEIANLNALPAETEAMAKQYHYESADAFLKATYGASVDMDAYVNYMRICYLSNYFYSFKGLQLMPLSADIEAYFDEHQEDFATSGITKDSGPIVDVRHLLVQPEGGTKDESNKTIYTQESWEKALEEAESLLNEWKNGDATQDSFATLAAMHTDDGGSKANGGLYQNITRTSSYVKPFLEWAVDETRKPGDTGIVKTEFGYHIMYFVNGQPQWFMAAQTQLLSQRMNEVIDAGAEKWKMEVNKDKITIYANEIVQ